MLIKITQHCSMNCSHCMNDAKPNNHHMSWDTYRKAIQFQLRYGGPLCILCGGEPTEHPQFTDFLEYALYNRLAVTVATNGVWMQNNYDYVKKIQDNYGPYAMWQVSNDPKYYRVHIDTSLPVFHLEHVIICSEIEHIYPMGRAKQNNIPWEAKASKCFNVRAVTKQLVLRPGKVTLENIIYTLNSNHYFCTPHIGFDGSIVLGESDLCPPCSHIDDSEEKIITNILNFRCHQCDFINDKLAPMYKVLINDSVKEATHV